MPRKRTQPQQMQLPLCPAPTILVPTQILTREAKTQQSQVLHALAVLLRQALQHDVAPSLEPGGSDHAPQAQRYTP